MTLLLILLPLLSLLLLVLLLLLNVIIFVAGCIQLFLSFDLIFGLILIIHAVLICSTLFLQELSFGTFFMIKQLLNFFVLHTLQLVLLLLFSGSKFYTTWILPLLKFPSKTWDHKIRLLSTLHIERINF